MKKATAAAALVLAFSSLAMSAAHADVITYYYTKAGVYNGAPIDYANVFATATFSDNNEAGSPTTVNLTMEVFKGLDAGGYVNDWAFNIQSPYTIGTVVAVMPTTQASTIEFNGKNSNKNFGGADGGSFDLGFYFKNASPGQLAVGSTSVYKISGASGSSLLASYFFDENDKGLYSAVHVQGYGASSFYKGVTEQPPVIYPPAEIPEPGTVALLGLGLLGFAAARRKISKSRAA